MVHGCFVFVFPLAKRGTTGPFQRVHTSQMAKTNLKWSSEKGDIQRWKSSFGTCFWTQEALKYIYIYLFIYLFIYMNIYTPLKTNMDNQNYGLGKDDSFWIWLLLLSTLEFRPWVYLDFLDWFEKTVWMGKGEDLLQKIESHSSHGSCLSTWLWIVRNLYLKVKIDGTDTKR